jgi:hypothetical protein
MIFVSCIFLENLAASLKEPPFERVKDFPRKEKAKWIGRDKSNWVQSALITGF